MSYGNNVQNESISIEHNADFKCKVETLRKATKIIYCVSLSLCKSNLGKEDEEELLHEATQRIYDVAFSFYLANHNYTMDLSSDLRNHIDWQKTAEVLESIAKSLRIIAEDLNNHKLLKEMIIGTAAFLEFLVSRIRNKNLYELKDKSN